MMGDGAGEGYDLITARARHSIHSMFRHGMLLLTAVAPRAPAIPPRAKCSTNSVTNFMKLLGVFVLGSMGLGLGLRLGLWNPLSVLAIDDEPILLIL